MDSLSATPIPRARADAAAVKVVVDAAAAVEDADVVAAVEDAAAAVEDAGAAATSHTTV